MIESTIWSVISNLFYKFEQSIAGYPRPVFVQPVKTTVARVPGRIVDYPRAARVRGGVSTQQGLLLVARHIYCNRFSVSSARTFRGQHFNESSAEV